MARMAIDPQHHPFYKSTAGREKGLIFNSMKDLFLIATSLGIRNGVAVPLSKREEIFDSALFSNDEWAAFEAAYVAVTGNMEAIDVAAAERRDNKMLLDFIESYANAGIAILKEEFDARRPEVDLALLLLKAPRSTEEQT